MSNTLAYLHAAIQAHIDEHHEGATITDWFVGYATVTVGDDLQSSIHDCNYIAGPGAPHASIGCGHIALGKAEYDLEGDELE